MIQRKQSIEDVNDVGGRAVPLAYKEFEFKNGDGGYMRVASGGYGDSLERDPRMVLHDIADGIVSAKAAREIYGVILHDNGEAVDLNATSKLRASFTEDCRMG
jgi:N-methylhydantoinase B